MLSGDDVLELLSDQLRSLCYYKQTIIEKIETTDRVCELTRAAIWSDDDLLGFHWYILVVL